MDNLYKSDRPESMTVNALEKALKLKELRDSGATLKQAGEYFGISSERARQLIAKHNRILIKQNTKIE